MKPRFRLFAGPNGSGKSSLFKYLKSKGFIHTEIYVSADRIEADMRLNAQFNFNAYRVKVSLDNFINHIEKSGLLLKMETPLDINSFVLKGGVLSIPKTEIDSYLASFIATYLADRLFESKQSFCFETVMSHQSKVELLKRANKSGYKSYLYFVFTDNYLLNELRIKLRVEQGEHDVDKEKIRSRFFRSFELLKSALKNASDAFLINNSVDFNVIAEKHGGKLEWMTKQKSKVLIDYAGL
jgi:predicted ABC-type ATPase